ncbi:MAG TPA: AI-2E family transporter [Longimicrobium sp.]|jgi:predicted PurR-regulated permease PerM
MNFSTMMRRLPLMWLLIGACLVILAAGMRAAASVLNPVMMAVFLAVLLGSTVNALTRRRVPSGLAVTVVILVVVLTGLVGVAFLAGSLRQVAVQLPSYVAQLNGLFQQLKADPSIGPRLPADLPSLVGGRDAARVAVSMVTALLGAVGNLSLTLFIFAFMLGGVARMERDVETRAASRTDFGLRFQAFTEKMRAYMGVRAVLGLVAAALDYVLLLVMGVEHALLWAVFSFLLSFVPNIGFTLSVIPPALMALLGLGWKQAVIVVVVYMIINNVVDNVIGPRYVGAEMKMSALLSFLSVIFWAWVLGPTGAVLAIPLTVFLRDVALGMGEKPVVVQVPGPGPLPVEEVSPPPPVPAV